MNLSTKNSDAPKFNGKSMNAAIGKALKKEVDTKLQQDVLKGWDF